VSAGGDDVPPVVDALDAIRREFRMGAPSEIDALLGSWDDLVGAALAAHSRPQTVRAGVLVVLADAEAWAGQLRYLDQVLVGRIAEELPSVTVREVRVSVARAPGARPGKSGSGTG
jgi:predicted nucleic acid-binding Zn ribbon protein